jgi:predicted DNA-binding protein with PD1-like motif
MSVRVHRSERSRHLVFRISAGDVLPAALAARLSAERVTCGWLRASGVLADVELRAFDANLGRPAASRRIAGSIQVVALESSIGLTDGEPAFSLRAVLARDTDRGLETLAGEVVTARAIALEVLVTALDDLAVERRLDGTAGVWLLDGEPVPAAVPTAPVAPGSPRSPASPPSAPVASWSTALEASARTDRDPLHARPPAVAIPMPQRPVSRPAPEIDAPLPEQGDVVDHFAFGRCDVVKSDGDRLHLRIHKDGRIREIALEMLRVIRMEDDGTGPKFKLERRI